MGPSKGLPLCEGACAKATGLEYLWRWSVDCCHHQAQSCRSWCEHLHPPSASSGGARAQWLVALSMSPSRSHCFRADVLGRTFAARCRVLCHRRVWPTVSCPDQGAIHNALGTQVWTFPWVMVCVSFKNGLCCISSSCCCCVEGRHTHIWSRARVCFCVSSRFCGDFWVCEFNPPNMAWTHAQWPRVASALLQVSPCSS